MAASWLKNAVFYEIYPQTFYDTNGDGIGDLQGIIEKLPYVKSLGCNAIWMNPCFDSPFKDGGYDVRDYYQVAPRYGTNEDLVRLFDEAHKLGLKILLDLVPGHTSEEHAWFQESKLIEKNEYTSRYIWTTSVFEGAQPLPFIAGEADRNGCYVQNYFKCQPALNYGFYKPAAPWQEGVDGPNAVRTRNAMADVIRFWLEKGADGFRVDMADSLVKLDGPNKEGTVHVWQEILGPIHEEYPEAAFVSEWNNPSQALRAGFDMDFFLEWRGNGYSTMMRDFDETPDGEVITANGGYFAKNSGSDVIRFLNDYVDKYEETKDKGLYCFITCNHDMLRPTAGLSEDELRLAYAWIYTMPGAPFLYFGDELALRQRLLKTKEGSYRRTGARAPMQWNSGKNKGFSDTDGELYLPVDTDPNAPNVEAQEKDPASMLNFVRGLIALRQNNEDLGNYSPFEVYSAEEGSRVFAYKRGEQLVAMNPGVDTEELMLDGQYESIYALGVSVIREDKLTLGSQSFVVLKPIK